MMLSEEQINQIAERIAEKVLERANTATGKCLIAVDDEMDARKHKSHHEWLSNTIFPVVDDMWGIFRKGIVAGIFIVIMLGFAAIIGVAIFSRKLITMLWN